MNKYKVHCLLSHDFHANTYIIEGQNFCVIIDAGASVEQIRQVCQKPVQAIFITHAHFDHIWYLEQYAKAFGCLIYMSSKACEKLNNPKTNLSDTFCEHELVVNVPNSRIAIIDHSEVFVQDVKISSYVTIGHSACSLSFVIDNHCFCGDLLFCDGIGRTDFEDGNIVSLYKSMKILLAMDIQTFYPGHGMSFQKEDYVNILNRKR